MYCAGVDVGASSGEVVILDGREIISYSIVPTGFNSRRAAHLALEKALAGTDVRRDQIGPIVATGYGRVSIDFAQRRVTEISCYARGINHLYPEVRTVIDVGGQDSKVIAVNARGRAVDFAMNDKCAAGTGRFLEVMARALELEVEELGEISLQARNPVSITSTCTVFAESEVVSLVAEGREREDIVAGLHRAIARRIAGMVKRVGLVPPVAMAGGVAKNIGVVRAIEEEIGEKLIVPEEPQIIGALGAALLARDEE
ncbi:MAG: acyl-CoA dehydratase activase [Anaerolineae bacterium]